MSRIYWDTMLFIYWIEDHPKYAPRIKAIHSSMRKRQDQLITSAFTFGEVLTGFHRRGAVEKAREAKLLLQGVVHEIVSFTMETADHYAHIRGTLGVSSVDAIHLACAAATATDLFLTNDKRLVGKFVPGIQFIASIEDNVL